MKKVLINYLFIVSLGYLTTGVGALISRFELLSRSGSIFLWQMFFIPIAFQNFFLALPRVENIFFSSWLVVLQVLFGIIGSFGVRLIIKENPLGTKIWFFLSGVAGVAVLYNFYYFFITLRQIDFAFSGSPFDGLWFSLISLIWALTYFFSVWYIKSKIINNSID